MLVSTVVLCLLVEGMQVALRWSFRRPIKPLSSARSVALGTYALGTLYAFFGDAQDGLPVALLGAVCFVALTALSLRMSPASGNGPGSGP